MLRRYEIKKEILLKKMDSEFLTPLTLAAKLSISRVTVDRVMSGIPTSLKTVKKFCEYFNLKLDELFTTLQ